MKNLRKAFLFAILGIMVSCIPTENLSPDDLFTLINNSSLQNRLYIRVLSRTDSSKFYIDVPKDGKKSFDFKSIFEEQAGYDSIYLYNMEDTLSISWDSKSYYFSYLLYWQENTPPYKMSAADSTRWYIEKKAWTIIDKKNISERVLTTSDELISIMKKDYRMILRFPNYYK